RCHGYRCTGTGGRSMKRHATLIGLGLLCAAQALSAQDLAVRGERVYPVAGPAIENGVVLVRVGKIAQVGPADRVRIPEGVRTLDARVVTPGLIDVRSVVGLAGYLNQPHDQDQLDSSTPIQPQLRAIDAYNPRETLVTWLREHGVTTV